MDLQDPRVDAELSNDLGQPVVMGQYDHLSVPREIGQYSHETVLLGWIHGLDRVVQHDESERAVGHGRPRKEQRQCERVQFTLAHDTQRLRLGAVQRRVQFDTSSGALPLQFDAPRSTSLSCRSAAQIWRAFVWTSVNRARRSCSAAATRNPAADLARRTLGARSAAVLASWTHRAYPRNHW